LMIGMDDSVKGVREMPVQERLDGELIARLPVVAMRNRPELRQRRRRVQCRVVLSTPATGPWSSRRCASTDWTQSGGRTAARCLTSRPVAARTFGRHHGLQLQRIARLSVQPTTTDGRELDRHILEPADWVVYALANAPSPSPDWATARKGAAPRIGAARRKVLSINARSCPPRRCPCSAGP
jgi:hypothetical protein